MYLWFPCSEKGSKIESSWKDQVLLNIKQSKSSSSTESRVVISFALDIQNNLFDLWKWAKLTLLLFQLFRRVAAALPGMDSTENKPPEDSILLRKILTARNLHGTFAGTFAATSLIFHVYIIPTSPVIIYSFNSAYYYRLFSLPTLSLHCSIFRIVTTENYMLSRFYSIINCQYFVLGYQT